MPQFRYKARCQTGEIREGSVTADTRNGAVARLVQQGCVPFAVRKEEDPAHSPRTKVGRVRRRDAALFTRQLSDLLSAGMRLPDALALLARSQARGSRLRHLIETLDRQVQEGRDFSRAVAEFPATFSPFYAAATRAGEMGGFLEEVLLRLAEILENQEAVRARVGRALAYPLFIAGVGLVTLVALFLFVIPTLSDLFAELGQELPLPTRLLIGAGHVFSRYGWILPLGLIAALLVLKGIRRSPSWSRTLDRFVLKIPWVGSSLQKLESARFLMILGGLLQADVPVIQALRAAREALVNRALQAEVDGICADVQAGKTVGASFRARPIFPPLLGNMMASGEESDRLGEAMERLARFYDQELERAVGLITTLLEPALIVLLGATVAFIAAAMILPVFEADFAAY